jgi:hypothetical protein
MNVEQPVESELTRELEVLWYSEKVCLSVTLYQWVLEILVESHKSWLMGSDCKKGIGSSWTVATVGEEEKSNFYTLNPT